MGSFCPDAASAARVTLPLAPCQTTEPELFVRLYFISRVVFLSALAGLS